MTNKSTYYVDESKPWLQPEAGWPPEVPKNYDFPQITLYQMLVEAVNQYGQQNAIWFLNSFMTYRELLDHVDRFAVGLHKMGLKKGDVLAIALPSCFQYVIAYYACAKLGVIVTGVNPTYKPGEVLHELKLTKPKTVVILDALYDMLIAPVAHEYRIDTFITTNIADLLKMSSIKKWLGKKLKKIPTGQTPPHSIRFLDLLKNPHIDIRHDVKSTDTATYIMTGVPPVCRRQRCCLISIACRMPFKSVCGSG